MQTSKPFPNRRKPDISDLVGQHYPALYRLALTILDDPDEADDAAQESIIAAARAIDTYQGQASLRTWLFSITINTCRGRLRRKKARQALARTLAGIQSLFSHGHSPEDAAERSQQDAALWSAVDSLDDRHRMVVILRYVHDLPVAEIARVLGIEEGTVHSRLYYARHRLMDQLRRQPDGWPEPAAAQEKTA